MDARISKGGRWHLLCGCSGLLVLAFVLAELGVGYAREADWQAGWGHRLAVLAGLTKALPGEAQLMVAIDRGDEAEARFRLGVAAGGLHGRAFAVADQGRGAGWILALTPGTSWRGHRRLHLQPVLVGMAAAEPALYAEARRLGLSAPDSGLARVWLDGRDAGLFTWYGYRRVVAQREGEANRADLTALAAIPEPERFAAAAAQRVDLDKLARWDALLTLFGFEQGRGAGAVHWLAAPGGGRLEAVPAPRRAQPVVTAEDWLLPPRATPAEFYPRLLGLAETMRLRDAYLADLLRNKEDVLRRAERFENGASEADHAAGRVRRNAVILARMLAPAGS